MESRKLTVAEQAAMIWLSGGSCYWPGCGEPAVLLVGNKYRMRLEIAHIRAANLGGPRYVEILDTEREAWANKILLCHPHHVEVDIELQKYPIETLEEWKEQREADAHGKLSGLRNLTEPRLQELMNETLVEQNKKIDETIARLEQSDAEAAKVMRDLLEQLDDIRRHGGVLDTDAVGLLSNAANKMRNLEDSASTLNRAASTLGRNFGDNVSVLKDAADKLDNLPSLVEALQASVQQLRRYGGNM
jgi:hypothetical protein